MAGRNLVSCLVISLMLLLLSSTTTPALISSDSIVISASSSGAREVSVVLTPDADSTVTWHDHDNIVVEFQGEEPNIDSANAEVSSDLTGVIAGTYISVVGDDVRISLPERSCENSDETYRLCPEGETITVELSGVVNDTGAALADQSWTFSVGIARISFVSPVEGTYLNTTSFDVVFASENHTSQFPGPHLHFMYDEHGASNSKMHKSMDPLQFTGLPEGQHLLILDLRDGSHKWLGHDESIAAITVTIDTIAPSILNEQLAPMVDANSVAINSTVAIRFSEMILEGASVTLANEAGVVYGSMSSGLAGSKSELIFTPDSNLSEGTLYTVTVDGVNDMAGNPMQAFSYSFTTVGGEEEGGQDTAASGDEEEGWIERWGDLTIGIGAVIASLIGWMFIRKSKAKVRWYLEELDRVVGELGENVSELEQQLDRMKKDVAEDYRKGRLDEKQYQLVEQKLDEASKEVRQQEAEEVLGNIPETLAAKLEQALADGRIDGAEVEQLLSQGEELDTEQKSGLEEILKRWKDEDESL